MLVSMNVEKVLNKLGINGVDVSHTSLSELNEGTADLVVVGKDLEQQVVSFDQKIVLDQLMDLNELETKLRTVLAI